MKILVTGAGGFIGSHLTRELTAHGHHVIGVDIADGDLRDDWVATSLVTQHAPDVVVHLAAQVGRVFGEDNVRHTITNNAHATATIAMACASTGARLTYVSTSEVYGDQGDVWCDEDGPVVLPHNLYGLSKRWGEEVAALYAPDRLQVIRLSMPYGPGLPAGRGRAAIINMLWQANTGQPIVVHRGATRCWCWVGDTVTAMRLVIERGEWGTHPDDPARGVGVYNIGRSDNETSMQHVALLACEIADADPSLIQLVDPPNAQTVVKRLSTTKVQGLGWEPTVPLKEGMARTFKTVRDYGADGMPVDAKQKAA